MSEQFVDREIPIQSSSEPSSLRLIATLGIAGLLAGIVLVGAYVFTLPIIERNKEEALQEAIYHVLPGCSKYEALFLKDGQLVKPEKNTEAGSQHSVKRIFLGYNEKGAVVGFAIPASGPGFQDLIKLIYGFGPKADVIIGFEVLESKETPGLGDKIVKDQHFIGNFSALSVEPSLEGTPKGSKTKPNQIETITGATISSKAVIKALQVSLGEWRPAIQQYIEKNTLSN
ncbi:MAG: FMN-binding protein [Bacteroidetes bacterium]|nr:FMN-binding protein [Bacteroidota bacterium]